MKFFPEDIDPNLCTHVIYAFAKLGRSKFWFESWVEIYFLGFSLPAEIPNLLRNIRSIDFVWVSKRFQLQPATINSICQRLKFQTRNASFCALNFSDSELAMYEWNDDKMYPRVMALKKKNPALKVLLAVGGWNHENGGTSKLPFLKIFFYSVFISTSSISTKEFCWSFSLPSNHYAP